MHRLQEGHYFTYKDGKMTIKEYWDADFRQKENLSEKEWVDKAKTIVARTQGDPRAKSTQLTSLKKEYIEKRYGKHIIVPSPDDPLT